MINSLKFCGAIFLLLCISCTTGKNSISNDDSSHIITSRNLANYISTIPRLVVRGNGSNAQVQNVTVSTIKLDARPLFVIDGVQVGRDFGRVLSLINEHEELEIEFMKVSRATVRYGKSGRSGVIFIKRG